MNLGDKVKIIKGEHTGKIVMKKFYGIQEAKLIPADSGYTLEISGDDLLEILDKVKKEL